MSIHVILVEPEIAWNVGNAGRSCLAAGAQLHLVEPLGFSLSDKSIRRSGLHYWPAVKPVVWRDWSTLESGLAELGRTWFLSPEAPRELWDADLGEPVALVFGRESRGLDVGVRERHRDRLVRVPLAGFDGISLNLSTAVGIALYEVLRQRRDRA